MKKVGIIGKMIKTIKLLIFYNFRKEVPRMLMNTNNVEMLEKYIEEKKDSELYKWWAQYMESQEKWEVALNYYKLGEDYSSTVKFDLHKLLKNLQLKFKQKRCVY